MIRFLSNGVERLYNAFATPAGLPSSTAGLTIDLPVQIRMPNIKCLSSFCGGTAVACLLLAAASSAFAEHISVGIKAGVPLTGLVRTDTGDVPTSTQTKRYTIGPVVDIKLLFGFGLEFGAMYKRFDQQSLSITTIGFVIVDEETSYPIQQTAGISAVGHSWEFPIAVQYRFSKSAVRPYVEGGVSLNRLSNVYTVGHTPFPRQPQLPFTIEHRRDSFRRAGPLFGVGMDVKIRRIHVTPGLRYTHYNKSTQLVNCVGGPDCRGNKAVDFLVGFTFSAF
jgi:hypothetical protein